MYNYPLSESRPLEYQLAKISFDIKSQKEIIESTSDECNHILGLYNFPDFLRIPKNINEQLTEEKMQENSQKIATIKALDFYDLYMNTHFMRIYPKENWSLGLKYRDYENFSTCCYLYQKLVVEKKGEEFYKKFRELKNNGLNLTEIGKKLKNFKSNNEKKVINESEVM